jgi:hypothetical protein
MCTRLMVIREVASQDVAEVSLAENEHVIQTLAPDRTDEPLGEGVLPRAVRCRENLLDPQKISEGNPMRFQVYVQRLTTHEVECGSEQEARTTVRALEEATGGKTPEGEGIVKVGETLSVTL